MKALSTVTLSLALVLIAANADADPLKLYQRASTLPAAKTNSTAPKVLQAGPSARAPLDYAPFKVEVRRAQLARQIRFARERPDAAGSRADRYQAAYGDVRGGYIRTAPIQGLSNDGKIKASDRDGLRNGTYGARAFQTARDRRQAKIDSLNQSILGRR